MKAKVRDSSTSKVVVACGGLMFTKNVWLEVPFWEQVAAKSNSELETIEDSLPVEESVIVAPIKTSKKPMTPPKESFPKAVEEVTSEIPVTEVLVDDTPTVPDVIDMEPVKEVIPEVQYPKKKVATSGSSSSEFSFKKS